jgi:predicted MFS family arabinose efflux permease
MSDFNNAPSGSRVPLWRRTGFIILCGCLISLVGFGIRSSYGLFNQPISVANGWGREVFAFALALQNLVWGLGLPLAGMLADRFGPVRVLAVGGILYGAGVGLSAVSTTPLAFDISAGVLVGLGLSGSAFGIVLAAVAKLVPDDKRSWAMGLTTAAGSLGQFLFAPLGQAFIVAYGWQIALMMLAAFAVFIPILATAFSAGEHHPSLHNETRVPFTQAMRAAFGHQSYLLLMAGFFVCGFQVAFITVHFPAYLSDIGAAPGLGALSIAAIGLFNIIGSYTAGVLGGKRSKRYLLSWLYVTRSAVIFVFLMSEPTTLVVLTFAAVMGLLWLSTVPLTSGLVLVMFGTQHLATLFGFVFFSHQLGSFLGVWLGGIIFDQYGSYNIVWWISIALGLFAALIHLPIAEKRAQAFEPA